MAPFYEVERNILGRIRSEKRIHVGSMIWLEDGSRPLARLFIKNSKRAVVIRRYRPGITGPDEFFKEDVELKFKGKRLKPEIRYKER